MREAFEYRDGQVFCEDVALDEGFVDRFGSPTYVYSKQAFLTHYRALETAFADLKPRICYSVKSCSNLAVLRILEQAGASFDVVSGGEVQRVMEAGASADRIVFAGVGKSLEDLTLALEAGIHHFNAEGPGELERLDRLARDRGIKARVALRINPDVDPETHRYITTGKRENKFGLDLEQAAAVFERTDEMSGLSIEGLHVHLGSQIQSAGPYLEALERAMAFGSARRAEGHKLSFINMGGGFGIDYRTRRNRPVEEFSTAIVERLRGEDWDWQMEPGRWISAHAGVMLTRIIEVKRSGLRRFVIVDAGMNDLIRPSLYDAHHELWPVKAACDPRTLEELERGERADVVGPICETGDFLALDRGLPEVKANESLIVFSAGAYGQAMASNYNSRGRPPEVLIDGAEARLVRRREQYEDMIALERFPEA